MDYVKKFIIIVIGLISIISLGESGCRADGVSHCSSDLDFVRTLVYGADLPSTNGILFNDQDKLFVTSVVGRSITQIDPYSGSVISQTGPEQGVDAPDDLIFDASGNLYWTSFLTGEVGRLTPEGDKSTVATLGRGVNAITISMDSSKLYVSRVFLADEVWEIDLQNSNTPRLIASDIGGFNGMDYGRDGKLYGPLWYKGQVVRIDPASGEVEVVAEGLTVPAAVKFSHAGELYVVDQAEGRVFRINLETGSLQSIALVGEGVDNLTFDSADRLYVSNAHDSGIRRVELYNSYLKDDKWILAHHTETPWNVFPVTRKGLSTAGGVAVQNVNGRNTLFVSDIYSIREYSPFSGRLRDISHSIVGGITKLNTPFSLSNYGKNLVSSTWFGNRVQVWDPVLHEVIAEYKDFNIPLNAIGFGDDLVVAELGSGCVMLRPFNTLERHPIACDFKVPIGLAQQGGKLWVSDWATGAIWLIADEESVLTTPSLVISGLKQPEGMAVKSDGKLLVVETGLDRLVEVDPVSGAVVVMADALPVGNSAAPGYPPSWVFNAVAVDECDAIYLSVDGDRSIRKIDRYTKYFCY